MSLKIVGVLIIPLQSRTVFVLYCTVFYCTVLYCTILFYIVSKPQIQAGPPPLIHHVFTHACCRSGMGLQMDIFSSSFSLTPLTPASPLVMLIKHLLCKNPGFLRIQTLAARFPDRSPNSLSYEVDAE